MSSSFLTDDEGAFLVKLARKAVEEYLSKGIQISVPENTPAKLKEKRGVFVTINRVVEVRGMRTCLLYTSPSPRDLSTSRMPSSA